MYYSMPYLRYPSGTSPGGGENGKTFPTDQGAVNVGDPEGVIDHSVEFAQHGSVTLRGSRSLATCIFSGIFYDPATGQQHYAVHTTFGFFLPPEDLNWYPTGSPGLIQPTGVKITSAPQNANLNHGFSYGTPAERVGPTDVQSPFPWLDPDEWSNPMIELEALGDLSGQVGPREGTITRTGQTFTIEAGAALNAGSQAFVIRHYDEPIQFLPGDEITFTKDDLTAGSVNVKNPYRVQYANATRNSNQWFFS